MSTLFWSEDGCDQWIADNLPLPERGTYCDVGCAHSLRYSQTAFLRERGWTGIAIDANEAYRPEWEGLANTTFIRAFVGQGCSDRLLIEPTNSLVSRRHETGEQTPMFQLEWLLRFTPKIDFLSIDVESMEFDVLTSLSPEKYPPIIVSEYRSEHAGEDFRVLHHLVKLGYEVRHVTGSNIVYYRP